MRELKWALTVLVVAGFAAAALAGEGLWKPEGEGWLSLFNGKDLTGWKFKGGTNTSWSVENGELVNTKPTEKGKRGVDIFTEQTSRDFQLHIEFKVPKGGNSGVYLRGRKEIQVHDSFGVEKPGPGHCGGLYGKGSPLVNACKPAGEWNSFDVTIVGDTITVLHNGKLIQDKVELKGCTGGALDGDDTKPGPLMMQGDHSSVSYRNIWIKALPPPEEKK
ncbi:MAG TPA: DUF1080 domain-containing protein [Planctomycetota bacterium]|nr:DUF1080 domain-containing protein [Planctomycetota bacterium]